MNSNPYDQETLDVSPRQLNYRCTCGFEVKLGDGVAGTCENCGRRTSIKGLDASQTVSFCAEAHDDTSFNLADGTDRSGEELGHFRLLSQLGQGGMGAVYRALDESLQRFVAVKVIRSVADIGSTSGKQVSRLLDEAIAQARLNHPNVVTIYYVGREGEEPFFAMELLPGPTLASAIVDEPLPYKQVILYARQICSALIQASNLGLVHGDIKPSNLILASDEVVKLGDFGLAHTGEKSSKKGISGTLNYMAPELASGGEPSPQSDMYSLGVTLFELTFGRRPYTVFGTTLREQISNSQGAEVEFPEKWPTTIPDRWRLVLERLLSKNPEERYADYEEFDHDLQTLAPVGVTSAGLLNRGFAFIVDLLVQAVFLIPFLLLSQLPALTPLLYVPPALQPLVVTAPLISIFAILVPMFFAWLEWRGWRTPGRYLFQLRVADEHGLRLNARKRFFRSMIRMVPIWMGSVTLMLLGVQLYELAAVFSPVDEIMMLVNIVPVLGPRRLAVHDRLFGSHVVLDTSRQSKYTPTEEQSAI